MGLTTYKNLQDAVLMHGFSSSQYLTYIKDNINVAQAEIARRINIRAFGDAEQSITTSAGTNIVSVLSTFVHHRSLHNDTTDEPLEQFESFDDFLNQKAASGQPTMYVIDGVYIYLYPTPDRAYAMTHRFYRTPTTLTNDNDAPEIPLSYRHLLVWYTVAECFDAENDEQRADRWMAKFEKGLQRMAVDLQHDARKKSQARQVAGAWSRTGF